MKHALALGYALKSGDWHIYMCERMCLVVMICTLVFAVLELSLIQR